MFHDAFPARKMTPRDDEFPSEILQIPPAPLYLYIRGVLPTPYERRISVVGSRRMTRYGRDMVTSIVGDLARAGLTIVSGLALGIDAAAHEQALENNTPTIAVLGGGVRDSAIGPRTNLRLAQRILKSGSCVLSEFPPTQQPRAHFFPMRNRIIAALSPVTLLIEAAKKSGALITADLALNAGREVWAVPGNVGAPQSTGTNYLLTLGANAAIQARDILDSYGIEPNKRAASTTGERILETLSATPLTLENLALKTKLSIPVCAQQLSQLELSGQVIRRGQEFERA